jgi:hypothetical protein
LIRPLSVVGVSRGAGISKEAAMQLRDQMLQDMELGGYSADTRRQYVSAVRELAAYFSISPAEITRDQLREYVV